MTAPPADDPRATDPATDPAALAAVEQVEVVDHRGAVVAVVARARMRAERLRHRCTYVAVLDASDRLVVHQRAGWKDVWPGRWDVAFGGVVAVGEAWDAAARRELAEEAGIHAPVTHLGHGCFDDDDVSLLGHVYLARHDGPVAFADGEVVDDDRVALGDLDRWMADHETCPDSVALVVPLLREALGVSDR